VPRKGVIAASRDVRTTFALETNMVKRNGSRRVHRVQRIRSMVESGVPLYSYRGYYKCMENIASTVAHVISQNLDSSNVLLKHYHEMPCTSCLSCSYNSTKSHESMDIIVTCSLIACLL
jgi:hypothetical protein